MVYSALKEREEYVCRCGWRGKTLLKAGSVTYADEWYVCPACKLDASECISLVKTSVAKGEPVKFKARFRPDPKIGV